VGARRLTGHVATDRTAVGPRPAAVAAVLIGGIAWALVAEGIRLRAGWPVVWVVGDLLPGLAFLACGAWAWSHRPGTRIGPLLIATGLAWYVGTAAASAVPALDRVAYAFQGYYDALLAWLVLAWPSGLLRWTSSRLVIAAFLAILAVRSVARLVLFQSTLELDVGDVAAVDRYVADTLLRDQLDGLARIAIGVIAIAVVVLILARWRSASAAGRRIVGPILVGGLAFTTAIVVESLGTVLPTTFAQRALAWDLGHWATVSTALAVPLAILLSLRGDRSARGRVADLVDDLAIDGGKGDGDLRSVLADALGDPTLQLLTSDQAVPPATATNAVTPLVRGGRVVGALVHDPALVDRPRLLRSVAGAAALAVENERLRAEVVEQLREVQASRARIVAAADAERRRIERDLHDGAQQRLVTLAIGLELARGRAATTDPELAATLDAARRDLELGLAELRELARGLHPTILTEDGLAAAIHALAERCPIPVAVDVPERRCAPSIESTAYFVVAEALTNVARSADASSASVSARIIDGRLELEVRDDGRGGADASRGSGLQGMVDRVAAVDGTCIVDSPSGAGTRIVVVLPCA
jgi:signal transduction histidine kinase